MTSANTPVRAYAATMTRAAGFLADGAVEGANVGVLANSLRELDRFLCVLIDAIALTALPSIDEHAAFARRRNTPSKLRQVHGLLGLSSPDHERLCEIGRARERLFHAARASGNAMPLIDWAVFVAEIPAICALYARIAQALAAASEGDVALH